MRRPVPLLFATAVVVTAACGGDDDTSTADGDDSPSTTVEVTLPEVGDRCETTLDPADYIDREIPAAVRPCETPDAALRDACWVLSRWPPERLSRYVASFCLSHRRKQSAASTGYQP